MRLLYLISVWLHILSAVVWIGGMIFLVLVLVPVTREKAYRSVAGALIHRTGVRFRWIGWICLTLLVLTGILNLYGRGYRWDHLVSGAFWQGPFGRALGIKLLLVSIILVLSIIHDFYVGPKATQVWRDSPGSTDARALRRQASWFGRINLLLALTVVAFGVMLVRGWP